MLTPRDLCAADANALLDTHLYAVEIAVFSQRPSMTAAEEAIYSDELVDADPESLAQLGNWNYDPPAWFVNNAAELELASEDLLDTELPLDDAEPEVAAESDADTAAAADAIASAIASTDASANDSVNDSVNANGNGKAADPASQIPMPGPNDPPLTPEQQRARALLFAEAELATALAELRAGYETQLLAFNPASEETDLRIGSALAKLDRVRGNKILFAGRWLQNAPPRDEPEPIWIQWPSALELESQLEPDLERDDAPDPATARYLDPARFPRDPGTAELTDEPAPRPVLEGWLAVTLGRYLHLDLDIAFVDPEQPPALTNAIDPFTGAAAPVAARAEFERGNNAPGSAIDLRQPISATDAGDPLRTSASPLPELAPPMPQSSTPVATQAEAALADSLAPPALVRFKQHRRLRSAELHYLDHPRLGVLVRIDPIQLDARTQAALERVKALR